MPLRPELRDRALDRAAAVLDPIARSSRLLESIAWPREVEHAFFEAKAERLPQPTYAVDTRRAHENVAAVEALERELEGDHPILAWLRALCRSYGDANRMLLGVGTRRFHELSLSLYGGARTTALDDDTTNLDFANHVARRLALPSAAPDRSPLTTEEFVSEIEHRLRTRRPKIPLEIVRDPDLSAKAICGMTRLRVREGATFSRAEADSLFFHEIETHALTAQNGAAQKRLSFLRGGGPRTTRTQEGLAVFAELYGHALSTGRLLRLVERVRLVDMAEQGASFLDLYRHLVARGTPPHDAYLDAQRICRGGLVEGGAPFTKDASYLSGLMDVYNFLRVALRAGARDVAEVLVSGRIALEDVEPLLLLREEGVLDPPALVPRWLERWDGLLAYFAFTSFLNEVDLEPVEARHPLLVERARAAEAARKSQPPIALASDGADD
jgi:uncharacterized protein (TIGR02421 family)